jgi:hypothetical protein
LPRSDRGDGAARRRVLSGRDARQRGLRGRFLRRQRLSRDLRQPGEPCAGRRDCIQSLKCVGRGDGGAAVCVAPRKEGEACTSDDECDTGIGIFCAGGTCRRSPTLGVGESCATGIPCHEELYCDRRTNLCAEPANEGESCDREQYYGCKDGLACAWIGQCVAPGGAGAPCRAGNSPIACLTGFFCDDTDYTCQPPAGENEPCNRSQPGESCRPGFWCWCGDADCNSTPATADRCLPMLDIGAPCGSGYCGGDLKCAAEWSPCVGPAP